MTLRKFVPIAVVAIAIFCTGLFLSGRTATQSSKSSVKPTAEITENKQETEENSPNAQSPSEQNSVRVTKVIDGDTIEIDDGQRIRYIGIDTPETVHPQIKTQCFGVSATQKNKELVEGKLIRLEKDVSETDRYGRLLRFVYSDNLFINEILVREGYASASSYPPDVKYQELFKQAETEARENDRGLWGSCKNSSQEIVQKTGGCALKGNISSNGEKIYHLPGQKYYDKTVIDESKQEKWFCSEQDAIKEGFRKSKI